MDFRSIPHFFVSQKNTGPVGKRRNNMQSPETRLTKPRLRDTSVSSTGIPPISVPVLSASTQQIISELSVHPIEKTAGTILNSESLKEKYSHLLDPEILLPLPSKYKRLSLLFESTDSVISLMRLRQAQPRFVSIKQAVESKTKQSVNLSHLGQFLSVMPECYSLKWVSKDTLLINLPSGEDTVENLSERKLVFKKGLLNFTKEHHSEFLRAMNTEFIVESTWHSGFELEKIPDIPSLRLPDPPIQVKANPTHEFIEKIKRRPVKESIQTMCSETDFREETLVKGVASHLAAKIKMKERAKLENKLKCRNSEDIAKTAKCEKLCCICNLIKDIYFTQTTPSIFLKTLVSKIKATKKVSSDKSLIEDYVIELCRLFDFWLKQIPTRSGVVIRMNKDADISHLEATIQENYK